MSHKFTVIIFLILLVIICAASILILSKKKECPDAWYINNQPPTANKKEYMVIKGKKVNVIYYDKKWIRQNCKVNAPTNIY